MEHTFVEAYLKKPTWCKLCNDFIWGLTTKGLTCTECKMTIHRKCELSTTANCPGSTGRPQSRLSRARETRRARANTDYQSSRREEETSSEAAAGVRFDINNPRMRSGAVSDASDYQSSGGGASAGRVSGAFEGIVQPVSTSSCAAPRASSSKPELTKSLGVPNEKWEVDIVNVELAVPSGDGLRVIAANGTLRLSNFQAIYDFPLSSPYLPYAVPLTTVAKLQSVPKLFAFRVSCKDFRTIQLKFESAADHQRFEGHIRAAIALENRICLSTRSESNEKADFFNVQEWLRSNGYTESIKQWDLNYDNQFFTFVSDGPAVTILPYRTAGNSTLVKAYVDHRVRGRYPNYVWGDWRGRKGTLLRCDRPKARSLDAGISDTSMNLMLDQEIFEDLFYTLNSTDGAARKSDRLIRVYDTGAPNRGLTDLYDQYCEHVFLDVTKSVIEEAYNSVAAMVSVDIDDWRTLLRDLRALPWAATIGTSLTWANRIVEHVLDGGVAVVQQGGHSALEDATLVVLVQLLADPACRTIDGFCQLLEKDWLLYGYPFAAPSTQRSQFFHFLHCVYELYRQHQASFEFNEGLLVLLADSVHDSRFGDFLFNNDKERSKVMAPQSSVMLHIRRHRAAFSNAFYRRDSGAKVLVADASSPQLWLRYLLRWNFAAMDKQRMALDAIEDVMGAEEVELALGECLWLPDVSPLAHVESVSLSGLLTDTSTTIKFLTKLKSLDLDHNSLTVLDSIIPTALPLIEYLSVSHNALVALPRNLPNLRYLRQLYLVQNAFTVVPSAVPPLTSLRALSLAYNQIRFLPSAFCNLVHLEDLDLSHNKLRSLPVQVVSHLTKLQRLNVGYNTLGRVPNLAPLAALVDLSLECAELTALPPALSVCTNLSILNLSRNKIADLASFGALPQLVELNISMNAIVGLPDSLGTPCSPICSADCAGHSFELQTLVASNNRIKEIPSSLWKCKKLERLEFNHNELRVVSPGIGQIISLKTLKLQHNQIAKLPTTMGGLRDLATLDISANPIELPPPSVCAQGKDAIIDYLGDLLAESMKVFRMKMMIIGNENVGKTSIVRQLAQKWSEADDEAEREAGISRTASVSDLGTAPARGRFAPAAEQLSRRTCLSTDGIDIETFQFETKPLVSSQRKTTQISLSRASPLNLIKKRKDKDKQKVTVNVWDFAGQDVYYMTHQFFLSHRSIYLVVFNLLDQNYEQIIFYWINSLKTRIKNPPVVIVGTHVDAPSVDRVKTESEMTALVKRLALVMEPTATPVQYFLVSTTTGDNMDALRMHLQELILSQPEMGQTLPSSYAIMEQLLEEVKETIETPVISRKEFMRLAGLCGMREFKEIKKCGKVLNDMGSIVFFDKDTELEDMVILEPRWLPKVMATLFTTKHNFTRNGLMKESDLGQIWKEYPVSMHAQLLRLLEKFEVIQRVGKIDRSLITALFVDDRGVASASSLVGADGCLIPALLPAERPSTLIDATWEKFTPAHPPSTDIERVFRFVFLPAGVFSLVLVRLFEFQPILALWKNGLLAGSKSVRRNGYTEGEALLLIEHRGAISPTFVDATEADLKHMASEVVVRVRGSKSHAHRMLGIILDALYENLAKVSRIEWESYVTAAESESEVKKAVAAAPLLRGMSLLAPITTTLSQNAAAQAASPRASSYYYMNVHSILKAMQGGQRTVQMGGMSKAVADVAPDLDLSFFSGPVVKVDALQITGKLGSGGYADVMRGQFTGQDVAVKRLRVSLDSTTLGLFLDFRHELSMQQRVKHANTLHVLAISLDPLAFVLEFLPHTLYDVVLDWEKDISWPLRLKIALELAQALHHMHSQKPPIAHLDLKSPNVMLCSLEATAPVCAKIVDFGTCVTLEAPMQRRFVDNPTWLAPEVVAKQPYNEKADTYAFGVICWELLSREAFFGEVTFLSDVEDWIMIGKRPDVPIESPPEYTELIHLCWHQSPETRPAWPKVIDTLTRLQRSASELERTLGQMLKKKRSSKIMQLRKLREEQARMEAEASAALKTPRASKPLPTPKALPTPPEKTDKLEKSGERDKASEREAERDKERERERDKERERERDKEEREREKEREKEEKEREKERAKAAKAERKANKIEARTSKMESKMENKSEISLPGLDATNILLVGFAGVGRSSLLERMSKGGFSEIHKPTGKTDEVTGYFQVGGHVVKVFSPHCEPAAIPFAKLSGIRDAKGVILVYDVTREASFADLVSWWEETGIRLPTVLVGNRCDEENKIQISLGKATLWGRKHNIQVFEVSAKGGRNVKEAMLALIKEVNSATPASAPTTPALQTIVQGEPLASPRTSSSSSATFRAMRSRFERSETSGSEDSAIVSDPSPPKVVPAPPQRTRTKSLSSKALPMPPRSVTSQLSRSITTSDEVTIENDGMTNDEAPKSADKEEEKEKKEEKKAKKKHKWPF